MTGISKIEITDFFTEFQDGSSYQKKTIYVFKKFKLP